MRIALSAVFTASKKNPVKNPVNHWPKRRITEARNLRHSSKINGLHSYLQGFPSDASPSVLGATAPAFASVLAGDSRAKRNRRPCQPHPDKSQAPVNRAVSRRAAGGWQCRRPPEPPSPKAPPMRRPHLGARRQKPRPQASYAGESTAPARDGRSRGLPRTPGAAAYHGVCGRSAQPGCFTCNTKRGGSSTRSRAINGRS